jgi:hypothetical protein
MTRGWENCLTYPRLYSHTLSLACSQIPGHLFLFEELILFDGNGDLLTHRYARYSCHHRSYVPQKLRGGYRVPFIPPELLLLLLSLLLLMVVLVVSMLQLIQM